MKTILIITYFFIPFFIFSQNDIYRVTYKVGTYENEQENKIKDINTNKIIKKLRKNKNVMEFELYFNKKSSSFILKDTIIKDGDEFYFSYASILGVGRGDIYYKNIENKIKLKKYNYLGELFLIKVPFNQYNWNITKYEKIINGYKCFRAESKWIEYSYRKKDSIISYPSVWFTNEIPKPFGPKGLDGLPGLVLEGTLNGKTYFYAKHIKKMKTVNKKILRILEKPKTGKLIDRDEFLKDISKINLRDLNK